MHALPVLTCIGEHMALSSSMACLSLAHQGLRCHASCSVQASGAGSLPSLAGLQSSLYCQYQRCCIGTALPRGQLWGAQECKGLGGKAAQDKAGPSRIQELQADAAGFRMQDLP